MKHVSKALYKSAAALLLASAFLFLFAFGASATGKCELSLARVTDKIPSHYESVPVSVCGRAIGEPARLIGGVTYVTLRSFVTAAGSARVGYDAKTRTATVSMPGLELSATDGGYVLFANGRALFSQSPVVILADGKTYVPVRPLCKALGMTLAWDTKTRSVSVSGRLSPIPSGAVFYDTDAVFWLSRIICAEAGGEPLAGMIAVGDVVMNRVASREFPNTIWGVIFDKKNGVQFSPVANGTVYRTPHADAVLAAKIALEGRVFSDRALFFLAPAKSTSFWIPRTRAYLFSIGGHDFYA